MGCTLLLCHEAKIGATSVAPRWPRCPQATLAGLDASSIVQTPTGGLVRWTTSHGHLQLCVVASLSPLDGWSRGGLAPVPPRVTSHGTVPDVGRASPARRQPSSVPDCQVQVEFGYSDGLIGHRGVRLATTGDCSGRVSASSGVTPLCHPDGALLPAAILGRSRCRCRRVPAQQLKSEDDGTRLCQGTCPFSAQHIICTRSI